MAVTSSQAIGTNKQTTTNNTEPTTGSRTLRALTVLRDDLFVVTCRLCHLLCRDGKVGTDDDGGGGTPPFFLVTSSDVLRISVFFLVLFVPSPFFFFFFFPPVVFLFQHGTVGCQAFGRQGGAPHPHGWSRRRR